MPNLREITDDILGLDALLEAEGGGYESEFVDAITEQIGLLEDDLESKVQNIMALVLEKESRHFAKHEEIKRLKKTADADMRAAKRLRYWLKFNMQRLGHKRINTDLINVWVQKNSTTGLTLVDEQIPDEYFREKVERVHNIKLIREDLKKGKVIPGVTETPKGTHLRFE
jgi:hypothetical protein